MTVQASEWKVDIERVPRYPADAVPAPTEVVDARMRRTEDPVGDLRQALGEGSKVARTRVPTTNIRIALPIEAAPWLSLPLAREAW